MKAKVSILLLLSLFILGISPIFNAAAQAQSSSQGYFRNLTIGSAGSDVASLQAFLISNGFLNVSGPTGVFGSLTAAAVAAWQASIGLPSSGYFGALSRAAIAGDAPAKHTVATTPPSAPAPAVSNTNPAPSTDDAASPPPANTAPITPSTAASSPVAYTQDLSVGDNGDDVTALQSFLIDNGFLNVPNPTGHFGPLTAAALASWQASENLPATGYFGPLSRADIEASGGSDNTNDATAIAAPSDDSTTTSVPTPAPETPASIPTYFGGGGGGGGGGNSAPPAVAPTPASAPSISLTNPANNTISSSSITVTANATDAVAVTSVQFTLDGKNLGPLLTASPYQVFLNTLAMTTGTHTLGAIAKNGAGDTASASTITISVVRPLNDITPPSAYITSPATSSTVTGSINVGVNAADNVGVTKVELYVDNVLTTSSTSTSSPYRFSLNTGTLSTSSHTLAAKAYDAAGNTGTTGNVLITVVAPAPTVPQSLAVTTSTASSVSLAWATSSELGGAITEYQIYRGGVLLATSTTSFYKDTGLTASTTYTYSVASYDAGGISSASSTPVTGATLSPPPVPLDYNVGLSVGENPVYMSSAALNQELNTFQALGVGWIRFDMQWEHVQPTNSSTYNWSLIDPVVAAAAAHHIKVLAILDFTPAWAASSSCVAGNSHCAPADPNAFAAFAAAAVARYSSQGVSDWEIWNEPNNTVFWGPNSDCDAYTDLLKAAYPAIKSADPNATVITAGLSPAATDGYNMSPPDFLSCIYADGGEPYFDAVGDHPYTFPSFPSNDGGGAWNQMAQGADSLRGIMVANGDSNKKIWVTEFGVPTNGPDPNWYVSEAQQSAMMTDAFTTYSGYSWAGPFFWYTYQDGGTSTSTNESFFGLLRADGSEKPAYTTLQNIIASSTTP